MKQLDFVRFLQLPFKDYQKGNKQIEMIKRFKIYYRLMDFSINKKFFLHPKKVSKINLKYL
jgi:hypothetical protein